MPKIPDKQRLDRFIDRVVADLARTHGKDPDDIIVIRNKNCPWHIECVLDYQTIKIRCVIDKIALEEVRRCVRFPLGSHQNFVRQIAFKTHGEYGYKMYNLENLVNEEFPHLS